jgi:hypothetical protein
MQKTETKTVCDVCSSVRGSADVRCETHGLDLCDSHMRSHFDRENCRLIPTEKEPNDLDKLLERLDPRDGPRKSPSSVI